MKPRLYLVDAHAYLHRAYHALPPLSDSKGEPVGALYGFARVLLQLIRLEKPEALAVCFDHPDPTFRHKAFEAYKATRKEIDEDLIRQLKRSAELVRGMGLCAVEAPGYEADDIMATLARRGVAAGYDAVLVTADKDALQMVSPGIRVLRDVANGVWMDAPAVESKYGIPPKLVIDYLSIIGDASDNVAGIKGLGPVGAVKLLKRYGSLKAAIEAAKKGDPEITPKTAKALIEAEPGVPQSTQLLRLEDNAPLPATIADCETAKPNPQRMAQVFLEFGFGSLAKEVAGAPSSGKANEVPTATEVVTRPAESDSTATRITETDFKEIKGELAKAKWITVAAVTSNGDLTDSSPGHVAVGLPDGRASVLTAADLKAVAPILAGKSLKAIYNLKDALAAFEALDLSLGGDVFDTMLAAYCVSPVRPKPIAAPEGDWKTPLLERLSRAYGHESLKKQMDEHGVLKLYEELELPLAPMLRAMEKLGVRVDAAYLSRLSDEFEETIHLLKTELDRLAGAELNPNSPKQLGELLYDKLSLPVLHKTAKGGRSTDEESLRSLAALHPLPAKVLEYREVSKLQSTYVLGLLERLDRKTLRVHTRFEQTGAETGRLSSVNPNLQNIPIRSLLGQKIRRAFSAEKGWSLVSADYSQIDLRVLAHVSQDSVLLSSFEREEDIHTRTASEVFRVPVEQVDKEMRRRAKAVNFGIVYGQTPFGLAAELGIPQREAAAIIQSYYERYPGVFRWAQTNLEEARRCGFVCTFLGRRRLLPELTAKNTALRQFGERAARNTPIQGGSADIIKLAMLRVVEGLAKGKFKARLLLQIHDELLFECPQAELAAFSSWVKKVMEEAVTLKLPLVAEVKVGPNWQDMEPVTEVKRVLSGHRRAGPEEGARR